MFLFIVDLDLFHFLCFIKIQSFQGVQISIQQDYLKGGIITNKQIFLIFRSFLILQHISNSLASYRTSLLSSCFMLCFTCL